jgi:hypothetical protein
MDHPEAGSVGDPGAYFKCTTTPSGPLLLLKHDDRYGSLCDQIGMLRKKKKKTFLLDEGTLGKWPIAGRECRHVKWILQAVFDCLASKINLSKVK